MPDDPEAQTVASEVGGKALAAVAGGAVAGVPGALLAVAVEPFFVQLAARSWDELSEARRRSAGYMLQSASELRGASSADVTTASLQDPLTAQLLADALQAAVSTSNEQKIRGLGRALANGLAGDEALVDEQRLIVAGLAVLEAPHIRLLSLLPRQRSRPVSRPTSSAVGPAGRRGVRLAVVAEAGGLSIEGANNVVAELTRTGMAVRDTYASESRHDRYILDLQDEVAKLQWALENPAKKIQGSHRPRKLRRPGSAVEPGYERTPFGDRCLEYLESMPDEDQIDIPQPEKTDEGEII